MRHAARNRVAVERISTVDEAPLAVRDVFMLLAVLLPVLIYAYGAVQFGWGFNELAAGFFIGGVLAGMIGRVSVEQITRMFLAGMEALLPAALLIGVARSISVVFNDGHVIDTILNRLAMPLSHAPATVAALMMIPFHLLLHVPVPSVSGQAVLTLPLLVPLSDLLGLSRQATVLAFQTGAGLADVISPTNGALMAILLAAGVSFQKWIRFVLTGWALMMLIGIAGILVATFYVT